MKITENESIFIKFNHMLLKLERLIKINAQFAGLYLISTYKYKNLPENRQHMNNSKAAVQHKNKANLYCKQH